MRTSLIARVVLIVSVVLLLTVAVAAEPSRSATTALDIKEITLDNGLRIFVLERDTSPTFAALYQFGVGGATDPKGKSGIAHLLEHMMFKGTKKLGTLDAEREAKLMARLAELWDQLHVELDRADDPFIAADEEKIAGLEAEIEQVSAEQKRLIIKNEYDELMTRAGGVSMNASTNYDVTRYYLRLSANRLELWFRMESDRLLYPVFREFYSERDVVYEERRLRTENTAGGRSREAMNSLLFSAHPYGTPVVGWPRDLERLERADAMAYFRTYYSPSNCVMALVGDVKVKEIERLAKKYFGSWERQHLPRLPITSEPPQHGERRRVVEFESEPSLRMAWMTVPEGHPDQYALDVLSMILGGLYSSRIDRTIVQTERLVSYAGTGHPTMKYAGYFTAFGALRGAHTAAELEAAIEREIARICDDGVTAEEVEKAKIAVETRRVGGLKSNMGQARRIVSAVGVSGGVGYIEEYEERINAVTPERVQQVALRYLKPERKNVVEVRNVEGAGGAGGRGGGVAHKRGAPPGKRGQKHSVGFEQGMKLVAAAKPVKLRMPEIGKDVRRVELDSGVTVFIKEDHSAPSVEMTFRWLGGSNTAAVDKLAAFELAGDLLDEGGTKTLTPAELDVRKDELGMQFGIWIGETQSGAGFWSLERNFDESFDLAMEILMRPRFDAERLATQKGQYIERMRRRTESPGRGASVLLSHVIYAEHPRLGYVAARAEIEAITPEQISGIWNRHLGPDNLFVTVVGEFETDAMLERIDAAFRSWRRAEIAERRWITHEPFLKPGVYTVDKELPQPAVRIYHQIPVDRGASIEDHAALEILNDILGGSGFRSRLMERLRSDEGLTYGIRSGLTHEGRPGIPGRISISYQTKKDSVARSIDSVLEEFAKIIDDEVSEAEVDEQIEAWRNRFVFRYTNEASIVRRLMLNELDDRPYDYDRLELEAVQKVTVADVKRVARKYLDAGNLTVVVFGTISDEDRQALSERFTVNRLEREAVFTGGYDAEVATAEPAVQ
jgi:predicted Zn-dependent peptidase